MPKIVDHVDRRDEIVRATWRVIARSGLAGTTMREIAREAGYSNGVLAHYFSDRADILSSALIAAHRGVRVRIDAKIQGLRGLTALRLFMFEALPLNEQGQLEARIETCFWGEAVGNEALLKIQNREVDEFCARARVLLVQASEDHELKDPTSIDQIVRECLILMDGLSIQSVMYPARTNPTEQIAHLEALLQRIRSI